MEIKDNFSLFNLFLDKKVKISIDKKSFYVRVPTVREFCMEEQINSMFHMWTLSSEQLEKTLPIKTTTSFELLNNIIFQLGMYREYSNILKNLNDALNFFIPGIEIDYQNKKLIVDDIIITEEI